MCKASNDFYDAHGYPSDKHEHKDKPSGMGKPYNQNKNSSGLTNSGPPTKTCNNCGLNNHDTNECRRPRINQRSVNNNDIVCFACNKVGHKRSQCPMNRVTHKTAAMQRMNNGGNNWSHTRSHQCDNTQCEDMGQIKLACGCMLPVVAGALSPNGQNKLKEWQLQRTPCCRGQVNCISTNVLQDTGSTTCVAKSSLVRQDEMTGAHELCMLTDGVVKRYPTAVVEFNTPYYTGTAKALCMENPVQDIIIGNIPGALGAEIKTSNDHDGLAKSVKDTNKLQMM